MRISCTSDLHGTLPVIPDCDLLLLGGDYSPNPRYEVQWLEDRFGPWLDALSNRMEIIGIAGNHDIAFQKQPLLPAILTWDYLQDSETEFGGLKIYGTPWQPEFFDWAFNLPENELAQRWAAIPDGTDILLLHGPPRGYGDRVATGFNVGSPSLTRRILEVRPNLVICGHIHEGYGEYSIDGIRCINVSHMDEKYRPVNPVVEIDL